MSDVRVCSDNPVRLGPLRVVGVEPRRGALGRAAGGRRVRAARGHARRAARAAPRLPPAAARAALPPVSVPVPQCPHTLSVSPDTPL